MNVQVQSAGGLVGGAGHRRKKRVGKWILPFAFLSPSVLLVALVVAYPVLQAFITSTYETAFLERVQQVGLANYRMFFGDAEGRQNLLFSGIFVFGSLALTLPLALGTAYLLNEPIRFRTLFRTVIILPWTISQVVTALLWQWLLNPQFGPAIYVLTLFGFAPIDLLGSPTTAMATLILVNVWRTFPFAMVLILAALQTVPRTLHESALVDGASEWQRFRLITLPLIKPMLLITTVMLSLSYVNQVDLPFILTGGGPVGSTELLTLRLYREAFTFQKIGFGSAVAVVVFLVNIVLSLAYVRLLKSERHV